MPDCSFDISRLTLSEVEHKLSKHTRQIYVEMACQNDSWKMVRLGPKLPDLLSAGHVVLKGIVNYRWRYSGYLILDLQDVSHPGWLDSQPPDATWRNQDVGFHAPGLWWGGSRKEGQEIYLSLISDDNKQWRVQDKSQDRYKLVIDRTPGRQTVVLKGSLGPRTTQWFYNVDYGIESFYVPEGKATQLERQGLDVEIAVSHSGRAVIKKVILPK